jgi:hypothetical protein
VGRGNTVEAVDTIENLVAGATKRVSPLAPLATHDVILT